ncbi:MAG: NADH-quinone oxidoreductase subunit C [bacterium]
MVDDLRNNLVEFVKQRIGSGLLHHSVDCDNVPIITVGRANLIEILQVLRDDTKWHLSFLNWLTAIDYPDDAYRFQVVYDLRNIVNHNRVRLKVPIPQNDAWIPTITGLYPGANWHEREMMELFGIVVRDHPDPRKLILPDWVDDHPLRKDFPHGGEELWKFHQKTIQMFNDKNDYPGDMDEPWLEKFNS